MKKAFLFTLLAATISVSCLAQKQQKTKHSNDFCIAIEANNELYFGMENSIRCVVSGVSSDKINLASENANIKKVNNSGLYTVSDIKNNVMQLEINIMHNNKIIGTQTFRVKKLLPARVDVSGMSGQYFVSISKLLKSFLVATREDGPFTYKGNCQVTQFDVMIYNTENKKTFTINGDKIFNNPQAYEYLLNTAKPGDIILFSNIFVKEVSQQYLVSDIIKIITADKETELK